jgi:hypothetical protein
MPSPPISSIPFSSQVDVIAGETESAAADVTLLRTVIKSTAATATAGGEAKPLDYAALERDLLRIKCVT